MLYSVIEMLRKKLGIEAIEINWINRFGSIKNYFKIPSTLVIPKGCEKVGRYAFCCCDMLEKVVIPESVEEISGEAFCHCYKATIILQKPRNKFKYIAVSAFHQLNYVKEETGN